MGGGTPVHRRGAGKCGRAYADPELPPSGLQALHAGKVPGMGLRKLYMIFSLTDQTYALLSSARVPEQVDPHAYYFAIAVLDHGYWILGSVIGSVAGALISLTPPALTLP